MIKVGFKLNREVGYDDENLFTYADYMDAEVGDIVIVNTRYGFAIAKVFEINAYDDRFNESSLSKVFMTVIKEHDRVAMEKEKAEKAIKMRRIVAAAKRKKVLNDLQELLTDEQWHMVATMDNDEIDTLLKQLNS